jgi:hypothetical protein
MISAGLRHGADLVLRAQQIEDRIEALYMSRVSSATPLVAVSYQPEITSAAGPFWPTAHFFARKILVVEDQAQRQIKSIWASTLRGSG